MTKLFFFFIYFLIISQVFNPEKRKWMFMYHNNGTRLDHVLCHVSRCFFKKQNCVLFIFFNESCVKWEGTVGVVWRGIRGGVVWDSPFLHLELLSPSGQRARGRTSSDAADRNSRTGKESVRVGVRVRSLLRVSRAARNCSRVRLCDGPDRDDGAQTLMGSPAIFFFKLAC